MRKKQDKEKTETAPPAGEKSVMDESLRRLGNILASPWLATGYTRTEPRPERAWLRRAGLSRREAEAFLALLCEHGLLDEGARAVVERVCRRRRLPPDEAVRLLLRGEGRPEDFADTDEDTEHEQEK